MLLEAAVVELNLAPATTQRGGRSKTRSNPHLRKQWIIPPEANIPAPRVPHLTRYVDGIDEQLTL